MSLRMMSNSFLEDSGAILVWVDLDGELEVDIAVTVVTRVGTGINTSRVFAHFHTYICLSFIIQP